jgi:hypothetical protein
VPPLLLLLLLPGGHGGFCQKEGVLVFTVQRLDFVQRFFCLPVSFVSYGFFCDRPLDRMSMTAYMGYG